MRIRRVILQWLCLLFRPIYHWVAQSGIPRRLIPAAGKQSVVAFERNVRHNCSYTWATFRWEIHSGDWSLANKGPRSNYL